MQPAISRTFTVLLALLLVSFFFVPEQHQRNWVLYLAAATAHGFLFDSQSLRRVFSEPSGWAVPALIAMPVLSLAWSESVATESAADLLLAGYCIVTVYFGVAHLVRRDPQCLAAAARTLLVAANLGALVSLGHWVANYDASAPRLAGALGLDNPVHGSILLLATTLPVWTGVARHRLRYRWLCACFAPCAFALLAGPRTALVAYVVVVAFILGLRPRTIVVASVLTGLVGAAALMGNEALEAIWLDRGLSFRPLIWGETWAAFLACNPLLGCGIATPFQIEYAPGIVTDRAHSLYVAVLYHQGVLGGLVFLAIMAWLLRGALSQTTGAAFAPGSTAVRPLADQRRDWALMLVYALLASTTSGDHILVRTTLFWCYFWVPVMVLAASAGGAVSETENSPAGSA